jgi:rare lipoprotein A
MQRWCAVSAGALLGLIATSAMGEPNLPNSPSALAEAKRLDQEAPVAPPPANKVIVDHSGRKEAGQGSFYGREFNGKKMANGKRFDPNTDVAASKSLPLGTIAKVTNRETGKSATVTVEDRGPYVRGRVLDVTRKTAEKLGLVQTGVAPVLIAPVAVPQPDGSIKPGAGAAEIVTAAKPDIGPTPK